MGISTLQSYCGAQIFEAIGLDARFVAKHFTGTSSRIGGIGLDEIARETARAPPRAPTRRAPARTRRADASAANTSGGAAPRRTCSPRRRSSSSSTRPAPGSTRSSRNTPRRSTIRRGGSRRCAGCSSCAPATSPIPIEEVEPVEQIVKRFATGAMSYGSISEEAHTTLAIAMNRLGGKSNTGEGGEDPARYRREANGDWRRSAIKQVASARFGVTSEYLVNAEEIQIKMAQGAKPGEGGQLAGLKVYPWIAKVRLRDARRRPDLAAAAPRHLFDRGPGAADLRPEERQPAGAHLGEAGGESPASARSPPASPRRTPTSC